jgi:hypothetical protein
MNKFKSLLLSIPNGNNSNGNNDNGNNGNSQLDKELFFAILEAVANRRRASFPYLENKVSVIYQNQSTDQAPSNQHQRILDKPKLINHLNVLKEHKIIGEIEAPNDELRVYYLKAEGLLGLIDYPTRNVGENSTEEVAEEAALTSSW